jgi:acyl carrier protein
MAVRNRAGLFRIVGRASRFSKIAGLRIAHDGIEALLARWGVGGAHATGTDAVLAVVVPAGAKVEGLAQRVAQSCKVPANAVVVLEQDAPRLPSGKVDYKSIVRLAEAERARAAEATRGSAQGAILAGYRSAFNRADIDPEQSFSSLGGDSLTFVNAMLAIEDVLGAVPAGWETMSIASLEALASDAPAPSAAGGARAAPKLQPVESEVWLRMLALLLVMTGHAALNADTLFLRGGSGLLLLLAGYSMARFARPQLELGRTWSPLGGLFARVMLPTLLLIALIYPVSNAERDPGWFLFLSTWTVDVRGPLFALWFVDTLVQITAAMCLLYWVPQVRRWSRAGPFPFALALLSVAWALKLFVPTIYDDVNPRSLTADAWAYIFILGWCAAVAQGTRNKAAVVLLGFALASADYGLGSPRSLWLGLALVALMAGPFLKLPSLGRQAVMRFSAAGFFIYLAHIVVHHLVHFVLHISNIWVTIPLVLALSIAGGIIAERIWAWLLRMAASRKWRNAPWRQQKAGGA